MVAKILIANRGEIACRIMRTARQMGIRTVAVYSEADTAALHVREADEAVLIGPASVSQSYIAIDRIIDAVRSSGADAVHPGYGFLSERAEFVEALEAEGVTFIGPSAAAIRAMGDKITSKTIAAEAGVPTVPGFMELIEDEAHAVRVAGGIGYPVMIKASAGGGGKGLRIAWDEGKVAEGYLRAKSEAASAFGDDRVFIEKFIANPRHIEMQVLGDKHGNVVHLGERECSIQRRNQKVIEEAPSPFLDAETRAEMGERTVALCRRVGYYSAGTIEYIVDAERNFYFLEMNTRLQVEHPVTELVTGIDLVEEMIRVAAGEKLGIAQGDVRLGGWAIESRLYAEDPLRNFLPSIGRLTRYRPPEAVARDGGVVRNDTGVFEGGEISMFYDPMIAKLCTWGHRRTDAIELMREALDAFEIEGVGHNLPFLQAVMDNPRFGAGALTTGFIAEEFPDGFNGVQLGEAALVRLAALAAHMTLAREERVGAISGTMRDHPRALSRDWVITLGGHRWPVRVERIDGGSAVEIGGARIGVATDWRPGTPLAQATVGGKAVTVKVGPTTSGWRLRYRGADLRASVLSPRHAELAARLPEKAPPDTSRQVLCPMPGLVVRIDVKEDDEVFDGQPLCMIEAMKMENVLRAERRGRVARIHAEPGQSMAVDDVIMEFE